MNDSCLPGPPDSLSRQDFITTFGGIYEHSPWVAERVFDAGVNKEENQAKALSEQMAKVVNDASMTKKLNLIRSHPDLVGKTAIANELSRASRQEQNSAGLDQCTLQEFTEFNKLNQDYKKKFDFPFIFAVSGFQRQHILQAFRQRIKNTKENEFATAIQQIHAIALLRLQTME